MKFSSGNSGSEQIDLSVVIVTFNCLPFVRLCLHSLLWKQEDRMEVIVVDNNSQDEITSVLIKEFPKVTIIANKKNVGFGTACNQGMKIARGRYFLMLNPDTFVPEDLTQRVVAFMDTHSRCGAMGVRMLDGRGHFLPESKRGLPTLFRSFCRFSGLSSLFPKSKILAGYYMGHLPADETAAVEILSGAFMVLRREAIEKVGGFDEIFFMYGEDIDLSWRIHQSGFVNYYEPNISIVHFKGESTAKDQRYVKMFYGAMELFYNKHFGGKRRGIIQNIVLVMIEVLGFLSWLRHLLPCKTQVDSSYLLKKNDIDVLLKKSEKLINKDNIVDAVSAETCILDADSWRPSKILDFVRIKGFFCKRLIWLGPKKKTVFYPVSSSNKTIISNLD